MTRKGTLLTFASAALPMLPAGAAPPAREVANSPIFRCS